MANKKRKNNKMYKKIDNVDTSFKEESFKVVKVLAIVLIFLGIFYLLTVYLINKDTSSSSTEKEVSEATIQYEEILAGSSFSINDSEYLVLYYDKSSDELKSNITNLISSYKEKDEHLSIYTVDMSSAFNKNFIASSSNKSPDSVSELEISDTTLIKFKDGKVVDYIENYDNINIYLS